jgi:hypothetical protein
MKYCPVETKRNRGKKKEEMKRSKNKKEEATNL